MVWNNKKFEIATFDIIRIYCNTTHNVPYYYYSALKSYFPLIVTTLKIILNMHKVMAIIIQRYTYYIVKPISNIKIIIFLWYNQRISFEYRRIWKEH